MGVYLVFCFLTDFFVLGGAERLAFGLVDWLLEYRVMYALISNFLRQPASFMYLILPNIGRSFHPWSCTPQMLHILLLSLNINHQWLCIHTIQHSR